jgi:hypothetical protein
MKEFEKEFRKATDKIEDLLYYIEHNENVKEFLLESCSACMDYYNDNPLYSVAQMIANYFCTTNELYKYER